MQWLNNKKEGNTFCCANGMVSANQPYKIDGLYIYIYIYIYPPQHVYSEAVSLGWCQCHSLPTDITIMSNSNNANRLFLMKFRFIQKKKKKVLNDH